MKTSIVRRIVILLSFAITLSSILIAILELIITFGLTGIASGNFKALFQAIIIVIPFVVILSIIVLKRIIKPIKNIASVAISITEGDFSIRADESLSGELGLLGQTMNKLSLDLYQNIAQLYIEKNRLYQVLNSLDEGMIAVDNFHVITHYNDVFLEIFDIEIHSNSPISLDTLALYNKDLKSLIDLLNSHDESIVTYQYKDKYLKITIKHIHDNEMNHVGDVVIFSDITESEKLEQMRKDYVANVSHELRSPLTSIRGLIEPLMDQIVTKDEDIQRYYNIIYKESLRLSRLIDDIMELSRLQSNNNTIQKRKFVPRSILDIVYERYKWLDEDKHLIYIDQDLPEVYSNYDRVEQILIILIDNAFKFTPAGGEIKIESQCYEDYLVIRVKDNGCGISKEDLPFVFDRFYKSDKSRTVKSTGLGLSIAKEICDSLNESIKVSSKQNEGSTFEFTLHYK